MRNFVKILKRDALLDNLPQLKKSAVKAKIQYIRAGIVTRNYNRRVSMLKNKIAASNVLLLELKEDRQHKQQLLTSQIDRVA